MTSHRQHSGMWLLASVGGFMTQKQEQEGNRKWPTMGNGCVGGVFWVLCLGPGFCCLSLNVPVTHVHLCICLAVLDSAKSPTPSSLHPAPTALTVLPPKRVLASFAPLDYPQVTTTVGPV